MLNLQVTINEDPKTRTIRELRAEVAFLRSQLAALHGPDAASSLAIPGNLYAPQHKQQQQQGPLSLSDQPPSPSKVCSVYVCVVCVCV